MFRRGIAEAVAPELVAAPTLEEESAKAQGRLREREQTLAGLAGRRNELDQSIASEEAVQTDLKQRLASGANVETEIEASERRALSSKRLLDGVTSLERSEKAAYNEALAEARRIGQALQLERRRAEHDRIVEALTLQVERVKTGVDQVCDAILQVRRLSNELDGMRDVADRNEGRRLSAPAYEAFARLV